MGKVVVWLLIAVIGIVTVWAFVGLVGLGLAHIVRVSPADQSSTNVQIVTGVLTDEVELFKTEDFEADLVSGLTLRGGTPFATLNIKLRGGYILPVSGTAIELNGKDALRWGDILVVTFRRCESEICYEARYDESKVNLPVSPECRSGGFGDHFKPSFIIDFVRLPGGVILIKDFNDLKLVREDVDGQIVLIDEKPFPEEGHTVTLGTGVAWVKRCQDLYYYSTTRIY